MDRPDISQAMHLFELYNETFEQRDIIIYNSMLDVLISLNEFEKANDVYKMISKYPEVVPDQITFNTLIKGACKSKDFDKAEKYFNDMRLNNLKPNRITYNSIMDLTVKLKNMKMSLYFIDLMQKDQISADGFTYSIILNGLKLNDSSPDLVKSSLKKIKKVILLNEFRLDEIFFNSVLDVCSKYGFYKEMEEFYNLIKENNVRESAITLGIMIKGFGKNN